MCGWRKCCWVGQQGGRRYREGDMCGKRQGKGARERESEVREPHRGGDRFD